MDQKKKDAIVKILTKLVPYWDLAEGFLTLVQSEYCDDQTINELSRMIWNAASEMEELDKKKILNKGLSMIKKIHEGERKDKEEEEEELDHMFDNL